jgi:TIR domain
VEKSSETGSGAPDTAAPEGVSRAVFLCYASHDADTAQSICQFVESHGVSCWMAPRDVKPGAQYADAIVGAINEAKAVVLVLSGSAVASSHVGREIERAASKHKQIVAFRIDTAPLSRALEIIFRAGVDPMRCAFRAARKPGATMSGGKCEPSGP